MKRRGIGNWGEHQACSYLQKHAFLIIEKNYYTRFGEIDIIAYDTYYEQLVFCEVKTRIDNNMAEYAVSRRKYQRLYLSAWHFMKQQKSITEDYRFDCIAIIINKKEKSARLRHHKAISQYLMS